MAVVATITIVVVLGIPTMIDVSRKADEFKDHPIVKLAIREVERQGGRVDKIREVRHYPKGELDEAGSWMVYLTVVRTSTLTGRGVSVLIRDNGEVIRYFGGQ